MSNSTERTIIKTALNHPGLLSATELTFVMRISGLPDRWRLSAKESAWLYDIGRKKLDMKLGAPAPEQIVDYKARACA